MSIPKKRYQNATPYIKTFQAENISFISKMIQNSTKVKTSVCHARILVTYFPSFVLCIIYCTAKSWNVSPFLSLKHAAFSRNQMALLSAAQICCLFWFSRFLFFDPLFSVSKICLSMAKRKSWDHDINCDTMAIRK